MGPFIPRSRKSRLAITAAAIAIFAAAPLQAREAGVTAAVNIDAETTPPDAGSRTLLVGHKVVFNEVIKTDDLGQAQILLLDQSAVTVAPNSELTIDKFVYDPDTKTGEAALNLSRGLMRFVGGRLSKDGNVTVRTPVATMGIRGGIALVNVVSSTIVDVTMLFGEGVVGETAGGQPFQVRRPGYFTRIEAGKPATAPALAGAENVGKALAKLQGREGADGGAEETPTEEGASEAIGDTVEVVQDEQPEVDIEVDAEAGESGENNDPNNGVDQVNLANNEFQEQVFTFSQAFLGDQIVASESRELGVVDPDNNDAPVQGDSDGSQAIVGINPDNFNNGDVVFSVTAPGGISLASPVSGGELSFSVEGVGDPDAVPNIFNPMDMTLFQSPQTFNTTGGAGSTALQGQTVFDELFFDYPLTSPDFDGVNGSRILLTGGATVVDMPTGTSFFEANGDQRTLSRLPYSEIGRFETPINGVAPGAQRAIAPGNVMRSPLAVDWGRGKALHVSSIVQDLPSQAGAMAEFVYGFQVIVGDVAGGGGMTPLTLTGDNAGSSHFRLNGIERRFFHGGAVNGAFLGDAGAMAVNLDGGHSALEPFDQMNVRQDPTAVLNHQFGAETGSGGVDLSGASQGATNEVLYAGAIAVDSDADLVNVASNPNVTGGVGSLQIDPTAGTMNVDLRVVDDLNSVTAATAGPANTAFFGDDFFGVAQSGGAGFQAGTAVGLAMASGGATQLPSNCACDFMHWGVWAGGDSEPGMAANVVTDVGFFFSGVQTPNIQMPISGGAEYNGSAYASLMQPGDVSPTMATGDFRLSTSYETGVSVGQMNLGPQNFAILGAHTPGTSALTVDYIAAGQTVGNGHGGFFGPNAENVGVTINIDDGAGLRAGGVAKGEK